jgi:hypothetical protein
MKKLALRVGGLLAVVLVLAAVAVAATPVKNGIYTDRVHHVGVVLAGTNVATPSIICHGNHYYPVRGVRVKSGRFSYAGVAAKANGPAHPPVPTKKKLTITGHFVTRHRVTGTAAVAGCKVSYSAKYTGSHP